MEVLSVGCRVLAFAAVLGAGIAPRRSPISGSTRRTATSATSIVVRGRSEASTCADRQWVLARWGLPPDTDDADILGRFGSRPMVEEFAFFQGSPGQQTVSQAIEVLLVPDEEMKARVVEFIAQHAEAFRVAGPDVSIFPDDGPSAKRRP